MIQKIKAFLGAIKINERLERENTKLRQEVVVLKLDKVDLEADNETLENMAMEQSRQEEEIEELKNRKPKIKDLLELVFDGKLEWYDYKDLKPTLMQQYYDQAQHILRMDIFNNEINFLKSNWSKQAIQEAHEVEDPEEHMLKLSWMLLGVELLKKRFEDVPSIEQPTPTTDNTTSSI